jgi:GPH family glycoside/pentoside/hexuronide:cation symporter
MARQTRQSVPTAKRLAYAAPAFSLAVVGIPIYVYIPKLYTDVVGVHIALLGSIILGIRIFDAVTDPLIGVLSDRTRSRFGRRRPYMAGGSLVLALAIFFLFNPPERPPTFETAWFGFWFFCVFLFWTLVEVPYESLGPEITFDYHERIALFGWRDGALIAGTLVAAASPAVVSGVLGLSSTPADERLKFFWISVFYGPLVVAFCGWCVLAVRERGVDRLPFRPGSGSGFRRVLENRPFVILLASYTIAAFGSNLPATLILYYVEYVLQSTQADLFLALYFVTGVLFLPGWVLLAGRIGKKRAWILSMAVNTGAFTGVLFLGPGDADLYGVLVVLSGLGFGATVALPSAMQADVIDYDELITGERREGYYVGLWSITKKLAAALGVGLALSLLGAAGYEPNVVQSEGVVRTLKVLYAGVPSLCNVVALLIALSYPVSSRVHDEIRTAVADRKAGRRGEDPLRPGRVLRQGGEETPLKKQSLGGQEPWT